MNPKEKENNQEEELKTQATPNECAEYGLLVTDYRAAAVTGRACFSAAVTFGSRTMTVGTRHVFLQFEFLFHAGRDFLEVQFHLDTQVRTTVTALLLCSTAYRKKAIQYHPDKNPGQNSRREIQGSGRSIRRTKKSGQACPLRSVRSCRTGWCRR